MPTVPVIQDSVQLQTDTGRQRVRADPDAFGAAQARGTAALAQSVGRVGEVIEEVDTEFDRANARELDNQLSARIRNRLHNPEDGFFSTERGRGRNAADNQAAIEAEIDAAAVEIGGQARSPRAAAAFRNVAQQRVASALGDIAEHSTRQRVAYENEVDGTALNEALDNIIAAYDNPAALTANLATADGIIARTAQRNGLGPELQTRAMDEFRSDVYSRVIVQLAATDPQAAEDMYALRAPDMTAQDRAELRTTMNGVRRQADEDIVDQAWAYVSENRAIPPELWAQVPGRSRIDIQNERRRRAEGGDGTGDRALRSDLSIMAISNPQGFARFDLRSVRGRLGESAYAALGQQQARIRRGEERSGISREMAQGAMSLAARQMRAAGYDLSADAGDDDVQAVAEFQSDLIGLLDRFVETERRMPNAQEQLMTVQNLLATREYDPTPGFGMDRRSWRATEAYTPYVQIPAEDRARIAGRLRAGGLEPTRAQIERYYEEEQNDRLRGAR